MRVRRSLLNFGTSALFLVVTMLVALKASPSLVAWLGPKRYGGARVVADGQGYLTLLELGLGGAVGPLLARAAGQGDLALLRETVSAGTRSYARVSVMTVALGLSLTPLIPVFARDLSGAELIDLRWAWVLGLLAFLSLGLLPLRALIEAKQRGYVVNLALTAQSLAITGLSLFLAREGWGMTGQAAAQVAGVWGGSLLLAAIALRGEPSIRLATLLQPPRDEVSRAIRSLSAPTLILNIGSRVGLLADNLVVGGMLGASRVTSLAITQRLIVAGQGALQSVGSASWAALAELHAQGRKDVFNRRLIEMTRIVAILAAAGLCPAVAFNREFVRLWMGADFDYGGDLVTVAAALNAFLLAEQSLWAWCFSATGKTRVLVGPAVASAVVNLSASLLLTRSMGLPGPLLGTTMGLAAVGLWTLPLLLRREFGTPVLPLAKAAGMPAVLGVAATAALWPLAPTLSPLSWKLLAAIDGAVALGVLTAGVVLFVPSDEKEKWRSRIRLLRGMGS